MPKISVDKLKRYSHYTFAFIVFISLYICSVIWIVQSINGVFYIFNPHGEVFEFRRGVYFGFGIFIAFSALFVNGLTNKIAPEKITPKHNQVVSIFAIAGVCLIIFLPLVAEKLYTSKLEQKGYLVCEPATERWLYLKTLYYTNSEQACIDLISETN